GSSKLDVRDATAQRRPVGKCFNCNKQGHLRKDCTMPKKNATVTEKVTKSAQQAEPARIFTASLRKWICGAVEVDNKCELVGEQTTTEVHLLGTSRKALLDTGSQISIIPLQVLQAALESGFDLDADVEEIPLDQQKQVFDASGNRMSFKGAIRLTLQMSDGKKQRIAAFVMAGGDGMLVLGTNALRPLGYDLTQRNCSESVALPRSRSKPPCSLSVTAAKRVYIPPGQSRSVPIQCKDLTQGGIFWSKDHLLPDVVWEGGEKAVEVPVTNTFAGAKIFRLGEEVGILEPAKVVEVKPVTYSGDIPRRQTFEVAPRQQDKQENSDEVDNLVKSYAQVFAVSEQELTQTTLVEHNIDTGEAPPIRQKPRPIPLAT
ncbi:zinc knuckle, partial [Cooperia oncophora]